MSDPLVREFLLAFWKIHILHHAEEQGVYGQWMLEELQRHGYRLSPGTLYPLLSRMRREELVDYEWQESESGPPRKYYKLTATGQRTLQELRDYWQQINSTITELGR